MITIGADPEVFLTYKNTNKIASAIGVVGGTKRRPKKLTEHIKVQEDNILAEFNITPAKNKHEFVTFCLEGLNEVVKLVDPKGYSIAVIGGANVEPSELEHPRAYIFGCDPDFNAWTNAMNAEPMPTTNIRSAGGHIHVGGINQEDGIKIVKAMDLFLGVPSVLMDKDTIRKNLYGKAGAFRPKKYGIEYRTLSNFWLQTDELIEWAYDSTMRAIEWATKNPEIDSTGIIARDIVTAINYNNKKLAKDLMGKYDIKEVTV